MRRGRYDRDELLARTDLRALLDELSGPATGPGRTAKWRCPSIDHDDVHPSVTVRVDRRGIERWKCWSGGHGGTAIDAIHAAFRIEYRESFEELARRAGLRPDEPGVRRVPRPAPPPRQPVPLHPNVVRYVESCERLLWEPVGRPVLEYLTGERGLGPEVLRANRVGADPGSRKLRRASGLPKNGPAAVFPACTVDGRLVYLQARYLEHDEHGSKYGNPASRLGDNPRHGWTQPAGTPKDPVVICEGFPDAYTANSAGYTAVAVLGATNANRGLAERIAKGIGKRPAVLAFDGDDAGRSAAKQLSTSLEQRGIMVIELPLPSGADLNSWVHTARQIPDVGPTTRPTPNPGIAAPAPAIPGP
jgi:DNA primase